jgi:hypothetical protein
MATLQEQLEASVSKLNTDSDIMHQIVHADWQTIVNTEGGQVKSLAKTIHDLETTYAANAVITISQTNNTDAFNWANRAPDSGYTDSAGHSGYSARHYAQKAEIAASQLPANKFDATRDPTANDDTNAGFDAGSNWLNVSSKEAFKCINSAVGSAVWVTTTLTLDDLGTAAAQNIGTGAGQIPILDENGDFPSVSLAVDAADDMQPVTKRQLDGAIAQEVWVDRGDQVICTAQIPIDNTIPQITEGTEILTASITPRSTQSVIEVEAVLWAGLNANHWIIGAIFRSDKSDAIVSQPAYTATGNAAALVVLKKQFVSETTSPLEFSLRAGPAGAYTMRVNGTGTPILGGNGITSLHVREVL